MKILAICFQYQYHDPMSAIASGLLGQLTSEHTVDILGNRELKNKIEGIRNQYIHPFPEHRKGWYRRFIRWFGTTPISDAWSREAFKLVAKD